MQPPTDCRAARRLCAGPHSLQTPEDKEALKACATDLRPFSYSFLPAGGAYWALSKVSAAVCWGSTWRCGHTAPANVAAAAAPGAAPLLFPCLSPHP